jgi:hypothetical protein
VPRFDMTLFGDDYLYFWADMLANADEAVESIWRVLELEPGMELLDLACGHGRIANRLAARASGRRASIRPGSSSTLRAVTPWSEASTSSTSSATPARSPGAPVSSAS